MMQSRNWGFQLAGLRLFRRTVTPKRGVCCGRNNRHAKSMGSSFDTSGRTFPTLTIRVAVTFRKNADATGPFPWQLPGACW